MTGREYLGRADVVVRVCPVNHIIHEIQIRGGAAAAQIPSLEKT